MGSTSTYNCGMIMLNKLVERVEIKTIGRTSTIRPYVILDKDGNKIRTTGDDGLTPKLEIREGDWYISYDDGATWNYYGQATGDKGEQGDKGDQGDAIFAKDGIDVSNPDYISLTLVDGTKIQIPTWAFVKALETRVNELNSNIESLQAIVNGLQKNDYVTSISDIIDPQTNEVIGYTLHFAYSGNVEIYNGVDGENGKDGVTPTVTISEDGYWVINGVKQSVKALAVDGQNGITPKFKIEDGMWFVSYDNESTWHEAGQATGDQGATGPQGPQGPVGEGGSDGDAFFKSITEEYAIDENGKVITNAIGKPIVAYIVITLNDGDSDDSNNPVYKIPTDYVIGDLQKQIDALDFLGYISARHDVAAVIPDIMALGDEIRQGSAEKQHHQQDRHHRDERAGADVGISRLFLLCFSFFRLQNDSSLG